MYVCSSFENSSWYSGNIFHNCINFFQGTKGKKRGAKSAAAKTKKSKTDDAENASQEPEVIYTLI